MVQRLKSGSKVLFIWIFYGALYCCVRYSNIEYQHEFFNTMINSITQVVMAETGFGRRFYDLKYFEVGIFSCSLNSL